MNQHVQLQNYINSVKEGYSYSYNQAAFDQVFAYLNGETDRKPHLGSTSYWYFSELLTLLPSKLTDWNELHDRVMDIATHPTIWEAPKSIKDYHYGCYYYFVRWMVRQLEGENQLYLVKQLEAHAQKYQITLPFFING